MNEVTQCAGPVSTNARSHQLRCTVAESDKGRGHWVNGIPLTLLQNKDKDESGNFLPDDLPQQKNRKRCWTCNSKLELAQRALGECKCGKRCHIVVLCSHPFS